jgi:hypothetical protein
LHGVRAGISRSDNHNMSGHRAGNAAEQHSGSAVLRLEKVRSDLNGEPRSGTSANSGKLPSEPSTVS